MKPEQPWIGFVHVQPNGEMNPLGKGLKGAFAHVVALATTAETYKARTRGALEKEGFS